MPRSRPSEKAQVRKGAWTHEEDLLLQKYIDKHGEGKWSLVPLRAGLRRCRKSCRLRWINYLRPTIKRGDFEDDEVDLILRLHNLLGNRWSLIAGRIPGRTANDIKNYWNAHLKKRLLSNSTSSTKPHTPDDDDVHMLENKNTNNKTRKRKKKKVEDDVINTKIDNDVITGKLPATSPSTTTTVTLFKPQLRSLVCRSRRSNQPSSPCCCKCHSGDNSPPPTASTSISKVPIDDEALWWESLLLVDDDVGLSSGMSGGESGVEMAAAEAAAGSFEWKDLFENPSILWEDI